MRHGKTEGGRGTHREERGREAPDRINATAQARSEQKKDPPAHRRVVLAERGRVALNECRGDVGCDFDRARVIAFNAEQLVASLQHAIELVDQHGDRLVTFIGLDGRIHVGAVDLDVALCGELDSDGLAAVAFQLNAHPHDALLVTKQSLRFLADKRLQRRGQLEVNAGYD
jgi:hypothetical protein